MNEISRRDFHARADANEDLIARVAAVLVEHWDAEGRFHAPNGETNPASHARAVLAILGGGGGPAQVVGYLRTAEEEAFGEPVSGAQMRWALADLFWAWSWNREPLDGDPGASVLRRDRGAAT